MRSLAYLDQAVYRQTYYRERIAADAIDDRVQDSVARLLQASSVQLGCVDLANLVPAFAGGPNSRRLECLFAGARR